MQEAFYRLARGARRDGARVLTFPYAARVVRNECYSVLRRRKRIADDESIVEAAAPGSSEEERLLVNRALVSLPAEQREVVHLRVFEGMTFQEIADHVGLNPNTAASRYRYALTALRKALGHHEGAM